MNQDDAHNPHLAHHFDSMTQQFESSKLGMWLFLATEVLMFGGLFMAYAIYRANNPDVYMFAHQALDTRLGAINTAVLLASSFTMAWAVRAAQMSQRRLIMVLLGLTLLGGAGFMVIKTVEYSGKYAHHLWIGPVNAFYYEAGFINKDTTLTSAEYYVSSHGSPAHETPDAAHKSTAHETTEAAAPSEGEVVLDAHAAAPAPASPVAAGVDHSSIQLAALGPTGVAHVVIAEPRQVGVAQHQYPKFEQMSSNDRRRVHLFFDIYYLMTGLHGLHVLVGMAIIWVLLHKAADSLTRAWTPSFALLIAGGYFLFLGSHLGLRWPLVLGIVLLLIAAVVGFMRHAKAAADVVRPGAYSRQFFDPVEIGGLYWHLVDLIWIFLFPLLYLIR
ncbi:MAG: cytochrome c oxidase subunit 3 [Phycisphaeraceae bacterium]|nr:cytochrome c oxidase subunit 3 [Phycisphaeraceae bacterium]